MIQDFMLTGTPLLLTIAALLAAVSAALFLALRLKKLNRSYRSDIEQASEAARQSIAMKDTFLANVSHEIRTPMNAIIGQSHIVLQSDLSHAQRGNILSIQHASEMLLQLTNDILDFSKIKAGKLTVESIEVHTDQLFNRIADVITYGALEKGLDIIFDIDKALPDTLMTDGLRLQQVLLNLLSNAVKFTNAGTVTLTVSLQNENDRVENRHIRFEVSDTGIGLTDEQKQQLFHAFTQADDTINRKYGGTGLGLTISKQLVEMLGGTLECDSVYRKGSRFHFSLPLRTEYVQDEHRGKLLFRMLAEKDILILDNTMASARVLASMLVPYHASVKIAHTWQEFANYLQWGNFDVICIDAQKYLDGTLRQIPEHAAEKIANLAYRSRESDSSTVFDQTILKPYVKSSVLGAFSDLFSKNIYVDTAIKHATFDDLKRIRGSHVLLVEDNEGNQMVVEGILEGSGIHVDIAANGQKGVEKLFQAPEKYDLILMDIEMPVMDGFTATSIIREYQKYDAIPIVAMTANHTEEDAEQNKTIGIQKHISKPIDVNAFYETLLQYIPPRTAASTQTDSEHENIIFDAPEEIPSLELIPGIDLEDGLKRVNGNRQAYRAILHKFSEVYEDLIPKLRDCISKGDHESGRALAHNLKGLSGNIGAKELYALAEELEKSFKEQRRNTTELVTLVETKLQPIVKVIKALEPTEDLPSKNKTAISDDALKSLLLQLRVDARKRKAHEAKAAAEALGGYQFSPQIKDRIDTIRQAVSQYQYDRAAQIIAEMYP